MKIPSVSPTLVSGANNDKTVEAKKSPTSGASSSSSPAPAAADSVKISSTAVDMAKLEQGVTQADGIDRAKIEEIKAALQRGDYPFDPEKVAEKMLNMESMYGSRI